MKKKPNTLSIEKKTLEGTPRVTPYWRRSHTNYT